MTSLATLGVGCAIALVFLVSSIVRDLIRLRRNPPQSGSYRQSGSDCHGSE